MMYAAILLMIIAVAVLGNCLHKSQSGLKAVKRRNLQLERELALTHEDRTRLIAERDELTWERDSTAFMLETAMREIPKGHILNLRKSEQDEARKVLASAYRSEVEDTMDELIRVHSDVTASGVIPEQRRPNGQAYFKDSA